MPTVTNNSQSPATMQQAELRLVNDRRTSTAVLRCLIVSESAERAKLFHSAAKDAGWETLVCGRLSDAVVQSKRFVHHLVLLDVSSGNVNTEAEFQQWTQQWSDQDNTLMMICGAEEVIMHEIWARQLGAWLYLPGVDSSCSLSPLFEEAKAVAEKLCLSSEVTAK